MVDSAPPSLPRQADLSQRRRTFLRLILFFAFVFGCVFTFQAIHLYRLHRDTVGDGRNVESYGFDLSNLTVDRQYLAASGFPKGTAGRMTLNEPKFATIEQVDAHNEKLRTQGRWGRIVVDNDEVIGVVVNGEARAYPRRYIQWHMILNDTLGGVPIGVTYDPLCVSAVVFDRRVGDETVELGFSGLVYNSNLVMYDVRAEQAQESLWCQLTFGPIAGPAVSRGDKLKVLPIYFGRFDAWRKLQPQTSVFEGDERLKSKYKENFRWYYEDARPLYPVRSRPADSPYKAFDPIMATLREQGWSVRPYDPVNDTDPPPDAPNVLSLWFAWQAIHGS
jgi:hypothetical protein